jgi:hypothetical protein
MQDLLLIENTEYVIPQKSTTNIKEMIVQAYINLFLTELGSIKQDPTVGVNLKLGAMSDSMFRIFVYDVNYTIFNTIKDIYNISSCSIDSISDDGKISVTIDGEYTFTI